ncbi:MAG TPA: DUF116 domain-containing protein [Dehalococcoidia bacterium]|jgi:hypothetical protein|nr:DUF116 domain-containing protein [Dehalococcoidia bacterium]
MNHAEEKLAQIDPSQRILLLPHCLRRVDTCQAKYTKQGLQCVECNPDCTINRLRQAALKLGYKGVCIAPGGQLALRYVKETSPKGIVAVACTKELEEGVHSVTELAGDEAPPIVIVPLSKDGCVDTEVNEKKALAMIALGCSLAPVRGSI